jgi:integrase
VPLGAISPAERMRLFTEGGDGLEPLWLWLGESGMPMAYESWEKVFDAANARVAAILSSTGGENRARRAPVAISPHMLRHSFALHMLVALHHALDRRFGLTPEERKHLRQVYGDPWVLVRDLLGHSSEQTTRLVYLEPLNGLQVASLLDHDEDPDEQRLVVYLPSDEATAAALDRLTGHHPATS